MGNCVNANVETEKAGKWEAVWVPNVEKKEEDSKSETYQPSVLDEPSGMICVVGATGKQGGAVVKALLDQKKFSVRAVTRNPKSKQALKLIELGVDVVKADLADAGSLVNAFKGCYGVFAVTNFWADMNPETEKQQALNIAKAAKFNEIEHILWSTLEDTSKVMERAGARKENGYYVAHFDVKAEIDEMFRKSGVSTTCLITSFFYENWISFGAADYGNGYVIGMNMGKEKLSMMDLADFGRVVALIFSKPEYKDQTLGFSSDELTGDEIAAIMSKHTKGEIGNEESFVEIGYNAMSDADVEKAMGFEMANMFTYYRNGVKEMRELRPTAISEKLTKVTKFDAWFAANADRMPLKRQESAV